MSRPLCADCELHNGVCPHDGRPCEPKEPEMLIQPPPPPPNPHHPFVYRDGEIRLTGDLGDRYEADVWLSQSGTWRWTARASRPPMNPTEDEPPVWTHSPGMGMCGSEEQATEEAVAWLRERCVAVHGSCG